MEFLDKVYIIMNRNESQEYTLDEIELMLEEIDHSIDNSTTKYEIVQSVIDLIKILEDKESEHIGAAIEHAFANPLYSRRNILEDIFVEQAMSELNNDTLKIIYEFIRSDDVYHDMDSYSKIASLFDKNYWYFQLTKDDVSPSEFGERINDILKLDDDKLLHVAKEIASLIDFYENDNVNKRKYQLKLLNKIEERSSELIIKVLEYSDDWDSDNYDVTNYSNELKKEDRLNNRISVEDAKRIISENNLQDILTVREGHVGLEDMKFDHLYDSKNNLVLSESTNNNVPWFLNRSFGDKEMSKDWFNKTIEDYKNRK